MKEDDLTAAQWQLRAESAEAVARYALWIRPQFSLATPETAERLVQTLRATIADSHPDQIVRNQHQPQEIFTLAESCTCDPKAEDCENGHSDSGDGDDPLCSKSLLGLVCQVCRDEEGDGPTWKPYAVEFPCPAVTALDAAVSAFELRAIAKKILAATKEG